MDLDDGKRGARFPSYFESAPSFRNQLKRAFGFFGVGKWVFGGVIPSPFLPKRAEKDKEHGSKD
jgi:hypothetical protein